MATAELSVPKQEPKTIREWLKHPGFVAELGKAMPQHCKPERMARVALTAVNRIPKLAECTQESLAECLLSLSQWGLEPDGRRAHLIPYGNKCTLIIDYKGLVELAYRSGVVASIHADVVCENDEFDYDLGEIRRHKVDLRKPRGSVYAAYCLVRMKDGASKCEVLSSDEIESIRKRSRAGQSGPWVSDWNEMAKKTAFRRVSKWLPLSAEIMDAFERDEDRLTVEGTAVKAAGAATADDLALLLQSRQAEKTEPQPPATPAAELPAWDRYAADIASCDVIGGLTLIYDRYFGPDCTIEWTQEEAAEATKFRDLRAVELRSKRGAK